MDEFSLSGQSFGEKKFRMTAALTNEPDTLARKRPVELLRMKHKHKKNGQK